MRKIILKSMSIILISVIFIGCNHEIPLHTSTEISGNWVFKQVTDSNWLPATVPGSIHTDLLNNGIIDDPFYRLNEIDVQWIDIVDWEYVLLFNVEKDILKKDMISLVFNGLDTYSKIYLNDVLLLSTDNMFIRWTVDCKKQLVAGENKLRIVFESAINNGLESRKKLGYFLPGAENDQSELGGLGDKKVCVFTRKAGYHFGWDWGPRLVSSGIWQNIELESWNLASIENINVIQNNITKDSADIQFDVSVNSIKRSSLTFVLVLDNTMVETKSVNLEKGLNTISFPMVFHNPELWWPNGLGSQKLYDIEVKIKDNFNIISAESASFGIRSVNLVQEPDSVGSSFYFEVNGNPVFMKGANYIPQDIFLNRVTPQDYANLIKSAKEANFNMLRVWGGGIYERDFFYDLCDEAGILIWQDFMFACAMYPGNKEFLENVKKEAIQNVIRLRNHPSIALWCGDNEILSAWNRWGWKENVMENQGQNIVDTVWKAYDDVFHKILPDVVKEYDPQREYWSSSPSSGFGELENGKSGDNHYWGVWWAKEPFSKYEEEIPRFMSEFGFQSFPEFSSVKKYTNETDWNIYSDVMKSHQRSSIGNATIEEYMLRDYHKPKNFEMFLYVGQLLQARGISIGIEAQRRAMPYCMGSLYWQLNDCWPVASWSGIDYYGNWKALHYAVKEAFKETILSATIKLSKYELSIVNDKLQPIPAKLQLQVMDFQGNTIHNYSQVINIYANSSKIYLTDDINNLKKDFNNDEILIYSQITQGDSLLIDSRIDYLVPPKNLKLPKPSLNYTIELVNEYTCSISISTDVLAKNVFLQNDIEGRFSENYFDLLPGKQKVIFFTSDHKTSLDDFTSQFHIYTLVDSY